jgi:hypothetical protein
MAHCNLDLIGRSESIASVGGRPEQKTDAAIALIRGIARWIAVKTVSMAENWNPTIF